MSDEISGSWFNQHGSQMQIEVGPDKRITGSFKSGVGFHGKDEWFPLNGVAQNGLITFCVNFGDWDSVTSWTGHYGREGGEETIYALWHMSIRLPKREGDQPLWEAIWSGADTFLRRAHPEDREPRRMPSHPLSVHPR